MTSLANHKSLRHIAPFHPDNPLRPSGPLPKRTKRSNACTACKARKSRCGGGQPCTKCNEMGTECIFNRGLDRRRKYAQRHAEQEIISLHQLLDNLVDAFDAGNIPQLGKLLSCVREGRWSQMITQQPHDKSGECPTTPPDDRLGGGSRSKEEINDALHDYCSSFDQIRLLRRRLTVVNRGEVAYAWSKYLFRSPRLP
ncbi:hypothetical protein BJX76DRAFT_244793 [Aspergillus varians]